MAKMFFDAEGAVRGRVASTAAKAALQGNEVVVLNCEKAMISGDANMNIAEFKFTRAINTIKPEKGPFFSKDAEKMMKRTIRGMLPDFRRGRGKEAWGRIRTYMGIPEEFAKEKLIKIKNNKPSNFMTVDELSKRA